jgi:hypothetical protein
MADRIAAPGAARLTLTGIVAAPDDFGRIRILLLDRRLAGGAAGGAAGGPGSSVAARDEYDPSWRQLLAAVGMADSAAGGRHTPHNFTAGDRAPDRDGVRGECWVTAPPRHRAHWLAVAAALRGRWARAEVTVRRYRRPARGGAGADCGTVLDLAALDPL